MKKTIFLVTFILVFTMTVQPLIVMNDIVPAFPEEERDRIEEAVIEGTIQFLQAKSEVDLLLKEYEKSARQPLNQAAALAYVQKAIADLERSKGEYEKSIAAGDLVGYATETIQKFKSFDYDGFGKENHLNKDILSLVKSYLSAGDILGAYQKNVDSINDILSLLLQIRGKFQADETPDISQFWKLLHRFSEAALFGNYCTITAAAIFNSQ